jgi:hypothetical protein
MPTSSQLRDIEWDVVGDEVITYLRNLLRLDTRTLQATKPWRRNTCAGYLNKRE